MSLKEASTNNNGENTPLKIGRVVAVGVITLGLVRNTPK